jgi:hypothetical protein
LRIGAVWTNRLLSIPGREPEVITAPWRATRQRISSLNGREQPMRATAARPALWPILRKAQPQDLRDLSARGFRCCLVEQNADRSTHATERPVIREFGIA